jgi:hypothetical protein
MENKVLLGVSLSIMAILIIFIIVGMINKKNRKRFIMIIKKMQLSLMSTILIGIILSLILGITISKWCVPWIALVSLGVLSQIFIWTSIAETNRIKSQENNYSDKN